MTLGEKIKRRRKQLGLSVEYVAGQLGVSYTTVYRYENSSIEKIPVHIYDKLCRILETTPSALSSYGDGEENVRGEGELPVNFNNAQEAMQFMLKIPTLAAYGGYDIEKMDDDTVLEFANEILQQLKLVSYKYRDGI